ncbi:tyrosinase [Madurella fahalii]|uniref:Tyrosinase n=1 Tax=Madurella fahalii TaxID=1157608 RepID=A0ABQ0FYC3_9PEZI
MGRLRLSLVISLSCLAQNLVLGQLTGYNYGPEANLRIRRQLSEPPREVVREKNDVRVRQEIRELEQDRDVWTLYILGLSMMQFTDMSTETSWFGIAGIHGMPHQPWGGVGPTPGNEDTGYCTHNSILFPTWHRPYVALYEQVLQNLMLMIASFWPQGKRERFEEAARRFRVPYWDWAAVPPTGESVLPWSVAASPFVYITGPNGRQRISNPLFSYTFWPLSSTTFNEPPWNQWTFTVRGPTSFGPDAQSNNALVANYLDGNRVSQSQRVYNLLAYYGNYTSMSDGTWSPRLPNGSYESLESLHDTIHLLSGGFDGHMSFPTYAAFDPLFWLHHCMVDRIFAIWQALYPESWVTPQPALRASYTTSLGELQDARTALTPFFADANGTFWTSDGVRDHTKLGYTYSELASGPAAASDETRASVRLAVNRLYGTGNPAGLFLQSVDAQESKARRSSADAGARMTRVPVAVSEKIFRGGDHYHEWNANIRVEKNACDGPFAIHIFLGCPPSDTRDWMSSPAHVGTMGVWTAGGQGVGTTRLQTTDGLLVAGTVPLTAALIQKVVEGELESLEPEDVECYLKIRLEKRVMGFAGQVWDANQVRGLRIQIASSVVKAPPCEEQLPARGRTTVHFDV